MKPIKYPCCIEARAIISTCGELAEAMSRRERNTRRSRCFQAENPAGLVAEQAQDCHPAYPRRVERYLTGKNVFF
jgi:hypothetical protein